MDATTKELIAIGASVGAHCQPCLTYHVKKAKEMRIGMDDIQEAVAVGQMVEKGAASAMKQFAAGVVDASAASIASCCGARRSKGKTCCG